MRIPETHQRVLENLAEHKYLTPSQMVKIGIRSDRDNMNKILREMKRGKKGVVDEIILTPMEGKGKFEHIYYLSKTGVQILTEDIGTDEDKIRKPIEDSPYISRDYLHRFETINFGIGFYSWAKKNGAEIQLYLEYFEKAPRQPGKKRHKKTFIPGKDGKGFEADALGKFTVNGTESSFLLEVHRGNDVIKFERQAYERAEGLVDGHIQRKLDSEKDCRILWVFEHESTMRSAIGRMNANKDYNGFKDLFLFQTIKSLDEDFEGGWKTFDGRRVDFLGRNLALKLT